MDKLQIEPLGDRALLVTLSREISEPANDLVLFACDEIESARIPGVEETQPAYSSFCVHYDPSQVGAPWLASFIRNLFDQIDSGAATPRCRATGREVEIPVKYGGEEGPDLNWASEHLGLPPDEVARRHGRGRYRVYMIGFAPGFPYLGGMDQSIALPRLPTPRTAVPAGSVAIGGGQAGVYPWESPGGWRIIGRTQAKLFSPCQNDPSLLHPGDVVRFVPVDCATSVVPVAEKAPGAAVQIGPMNGASTATAIGAMAGAATGDVGGATAGAMPGAMPGAIAGAAGDVPSVPTFMVEHPGLLSLVVDEGRKGYRKLGVPVSGAADTMSYALANILCGNSPSAPALEMTLWGARLRALMDIVVAVTGAPSPVTLDGMPVTMNEPFLMPEGSLLEVGSPRAGCRMYLAASGGFSVPCVMGSASTYLRGSFGGFKSRRLLRGDTLRTGPGAEYEEIRKSLSVHPTDKQTGSPLPSWSGQARWRDLADWPERLKRFSQEEVPSLRVIPGPESASAEGGSLLDVLCGQPYVVRSDSDRMGVRLDGPVLEPGRGSGDILSSPVVPGIIQVPSDGMPVLLLSDAQTCGGYRRVATVIGEDLPLAGQARPGSRVKFVLRR